MMNKWLTKEEFLNNPIDGYCWVIYDRFIFISSYYQHKECFDNYIDILDMDDLLPLDSNKISYVMPIYMPEAPKNHNVNRRISQPA